jgi:hypothetical protein
LCWWTAIETFVSVFWGSIPRAATYVCLYA